MGDREERNYGMCVAGKGRRAAREKPPHSLVPQGQELAGDGTDGTYRCGYGVSSAGEEGDGERGGVMRRRRGR